MSKVQELSLVSIFLKLTEALVARTPGVSCSKLFAEASILSVSPVLFHYGKKYSLPVIRVLLETPAGIEIFFTSFLGLRASKLYFYFSKYLLSLMTKVC